MTLTAPTTLGDHVLRFRLVNENIAWFDQVLAQTITVGTLAAQYAASAAVLWNSGETKTFSVTVQNTGTIPWSHSGASSVRLGVYFDAPNDDVGSWSSEPVRFDLAGDVPPGGSATIQVTMTAPTSPGDHVLRFRLVSGNTTWFSQVLAQTITVGSLAAQYTASVPVLWNSGETKAFSVTVQNTGTAPWPAGGTVPVKLAAYFDATSDAPNTWPAEPIRFSLPSDVAPGASVTIPVTLSAPTAPGQHVLRMRMVKGTATWFNQVLAATVTVGTLSASYTTTAPTAWGLAATKVFTTTVTNTGTTTWKASGADRTRLAVYFNGTSDAPGAWPSDPLRVPLTQDVAPGQSQTLTVTITSPATAGSYVLRQRMVTEGVAFFSQLAKTNVTVAKATLAASYSSSPPTSWIIKEKRTYNITLTNTGTQTWNNSGTNPVNLGIYFGDLRDAANAWTTQPKRYTLPNSVAPGQSVTMSITVQAPAAAGSYILRARMVKENVGWFDYFQKTAVTVNTLNASYSGAVPTTWSRNQQRTYSLTVTNTGVTTWNTTGTNPVMIGVYFGGASDVAGSWTAEPKRVAWPTGVTSVAPGQSVTLSVTVRAPTTAGSYILRHRLVKENVGWFDDMLKTNVTVT